MCVCAQSCPDLCDPMVCSPPDPLFMEFSDRNTRVFPTPGDLSDAGIEPASLHLLHWQADSLPPYHLGDLKNWVRVGYKTGT